MGFENVKPAQRNWEGTFTTWAQPPSETERRRCENAERQVREAIDRSPALSWRTIKVFPQGSYRNRTNVRAESDVDICVCCTDVLFSDLTEGITDAEVGLRPADYHYSQFKNEVGEALQDYFGKGAVTRGNKAFDVHENTTRVDSDVVATFEHRRYERGSDGRIYLHKGTELRPDNGGRVINWPQQNYDKGVTKRERTNHRFKKIVRIVKNLRNEMNSAGVPAAKPIASFLLECLVYNAPDRLFGTGTYYDDVRNILAFLWDRTTSDEKCADFLEVNELKFLFHSSQGWTRAQVNDFTLAAWGYVGFK